MDSLLASYASSDDDGEAEISRPPKPSSVSASGISPKSSSLSASGTPRSSSPFLRSLPPPRAYASSSSSSSSSSPSSFLSSSLPPPKSLLPSQSLNDNNEHDDEGKPLIQPKSPYIFSSLPPPKASSFSTSSSLPAPKFQSGNQSNKQSLDKNHNKRIVHFTLPLNPSVFKSQDSDNDDNDEEKRRKATKDDVPFSFSKALSSMLPAPKNSLCIAPAQSFSASRRSSLQAEASTPKGAPESKAEPMVGIMGADQDMATGFYDTYGSYAREQGTSDYVNCMNDEGNWTSKIMDHGVVGLMDSTYATNPSISQGEQIDGNGAGYESYMDNWSNVSQVARQSEVLDMRIITGKRGRTNIPTEIVEVKQDELMKNRPREDQAKLTGIAFGPAYQPAPSSKGKPSKLHKRKHQIGSLYYDLKQKEMELAERRSKGLLTKAETQAKYGW